MKVLGLSSKIKIGNSQYEVSKIERKGLSLKDGKNQITVFELSDILENLRTGVMSVK